MKKIVIIAVYFGDFPKHHRLFVESIKYNPTIDFKIFTNQKVKSDVKNLEYVYMTLKDLDALIKNRLGPSFYISRAYKCCDYKPAYGAIFQDYIKDYDFWGHCDLDVIFGDIRGFIDKSILNKYDKILPLGHLSLYRNNDIVNNRYKNDGSLVGNYSDVFSSDKSVAFDETNGINMIYRKNMYPFYDKRVFADISTMRKRFTLPSFDNNYNNQVFYWERGHVLRAFMKNSNVQKDEFIYIHFQKRKYLDDFVDGNIKSFYICNDGFLNKKIGLPTKKEIKKYNCFRGVFYEFIETKYKYWRNKIRIRLNK